MTTNGYVKNNSIGHCKTDTNRRKVSRSASLHNELSERLIFVMNKMKIKLVRNISRISLK